MGINHTPWLAHVVIMFPIGRKILCKRKVYIYDVYMLHKRFNMFFFCVQPTKQNNFSRLPIMQSDVWCNAEMSFVQSKTIKQNTMLYGRQLYRYIDYAMLNAQQSI